MNGQPNMPPENKNLRKGPCKCGCGEPPSVDSRGRVNLYVRGHCKPKNGRVLGGDGYVRLNMSSHPRASKGYVREHIVVAMKATGVSISARNQVHHVNEVRSDNRTSNLVICEDAAYHKLLHQRARALRACGRADWRSCQFCKTYSPVDQLLFKRSRTGTNIYHFHCRSGYNARNYIDRKTRRSS